MANDRIKATLELDFNARLGTLEKQLAETQAKIAKKMQLGLDTTDGVRQIERLGKELDKLKGKLDAVARETAGALKGASQLAAGSASQIRAGAGASGYGAYERKIIEELVKKIGNSVQDKILTELTNKTLTAPKGSKAASYTSSDLTRMAQAQMRPTIERMVADVLGGRASTARGRSAQNQTLENIVGLENLPNKVKHFVSILQEAFSNIDALNAELRTHVSGSKRVSDTARKATQSATLADRERSKVIDSITQKTTAQATASSKALQDYTEKVRKLVREEEAAARRGEQTNLRRLSGMRLYLQQLTKVAEAERRTGNLNSNQARNLDLRIGGASDLVSYISNVAVPGIRAGRGHADYASSRRRASMQSWEVLNSASRAFRNAEDLKRSNVYGIDLNTLKMALGALESGERRFGGLQSSAEARVARDRALLGSSDALSAAERSRIQQRIKRNEGLSQQYQMHSTELASRRSAFGKTYTTLEYEIASAQARASGVPGGYVNAYAQQLAYSGASSRDLMREAKGYQRGGGVAGIGLRHGLRAGVGALDSQIASAEAYLASGVKISKAERDEILKALEETRKIQAQHVAEMNALYQQDAVNLERARTRRVAERKRAVLDERAGTKESRTQEMYAMLNAVGGDTSRIRSMSAIELQRLREAHLEGMRGMRGGRGGELPSEDAMFAISNEIRARASTLGRPNVLQKLLFHFTGARLGGSGGDGTGTGAHAYGRSDDTTFHMINKRVTNIAQMMGTSLYGMGLFGAGSAMVAGPINLATQKESMVNTLGGLVNTFTRFRDAAGNAVKPAENFTRALELSGKVYEEVRGKAAKSILTTQEMFDYFMSGAPQLMARGMSTSKSLDIVNVVASLGKSMGLQSTAVQSDIRDLATGRVTTRSQVLRTLGFDSQQLSTARAKGPEALEAYFNKVIKGFQPALDRLAELGQTKLSRFVNMLQQTGIALGEKLADRLLPILERLTKRLDEWNSNGVLDKFATSFGGFVESLMNALEWVVTNVGPLVADVNNIVFIGLGVSLSKFLIGLIVSSQKFQSLVGNEFANGFSNMGPIATTAIAAFFATMLIAWSKHTQAAKERIAGEVESLTEKVRTGSGYSADAQKEIDSRTIGSVVTQLKAGKSLPEIIGAARAANMRAFNQYVNPNTNEWVNATIQGGPAVGLSGALGEGLNDSARGLLHAMGLPMMSAGQALAGIGQAGVDSQDTVANVGLVESTASALIRKMMGSVWVNKQTNVSDSGLISSFFGRYGSGSQMRNRFLDYYSKMQKSGNYTGDLQLVPSVNQSELQSTVAAGKQSILEGQIINIERSLARFDSAIQHSSDTLAKSGLISQRYGLSKQLLGLQFRGDQSRILQEIANTDDPTKLAGLRYDLTNLGAKYAKSVEEARMAYEDQIRALRESIQTQREEVRYRSQNLELQKREFEISKMEQVAGAIDRSSPQGIQAYMAAQANIYARGSALDAERLRLANSHTDAQMSILKGRGDSFASVSKFFGLGPDGGVNLALGNDAKTEIERAMQDYKDAVDSLAEISKADAEQRAITAEKQIQANKEMVNSLDNVSNANAQVSAAIQRQVDALLQATDTAYRDLPPGVSGPVAGKGRGVLPSINPMKPILGNIPGFKPPAGTPAPTPPPATSPGGSRTYRDTLGGNSVALVDGQLLVDGHPASPEELRMLELQKHEAYYAYIQSRYGRIGEYANTFSGLSRDYYANMSGANMQALQGRLALAGAAPEQRSFIGYQGALESRLYGYMNNQFGVTNGYQSQIALASAFQSIGYQLQTLKQFSPNDYNSIMSPGNFDKMTYLLNRSGLAGNPDALRTAQGMIYGMPGHSISPEQFDPQRLIQYADGIAKAAMRVQSRLSFAAQAITGVLSSFSSAIDRQYEISSASWNNRVDAIGSNFYDMPYQSQINALSIGLVRARQGTEIMRTERTGALAQLITQGGLAQDPYTRMAILGQILNFQANGRSMLSASRRAEIMGSIHGGVPGGDWQAWFTNLGQQISPDFGNLMSGIMAGTTGDFAARQRIAQLQMEQARVGRDAGFQYDRDRMAYQGQKYDDLVARTSERVFNPVAGVRSIVDPLGAGSERYARRSQELASSIALQMSAMEARDKQEIVFAGGVVPTPSGPMYVPPMSRYDLNTRNNPNYYESMRHQMTIQGQRSLVGGMNAINTSALQVKGAVGLGGSSFFGALFDNPYGITNGGLGGALSALANPLTSLMSQRGQTGSQVLMAALGGSGQLSGMLNDPTMRQFAKITGFTRGPAGTVIPQLGIDRGAALRYGLQSVGGTLAGQYGGLGLGSLLFRNKDRQSISFGASLGTAAGSFGLLGGLGLAGGPLGAIAGGLMGGLFGGLFGGKQLSAEERHRRDLESQHNQRVEDLLSRINDGLRVSNDFLRTIKGEVLYGKETGWYSGRAYNRLGLQGAVYGR